MSRLGRKTLKVAFCDTNFNRESPSWKVEPRNGWARSGFRSNPQAQPRFQAVGSRKPRQGQGKTPGGPARCKAQKQSVEKARAAQRTSQPQQKQNKQNISPTRSVAFLDSLCGGYVAAPLCRRPSSLEDLVVRHRPNPAPLHHQPELAVLLACDPHKTSRICRV